MNPRTRRQRRLRRHWGYLYPVRMGNAVAYQDLAHYGMRRFPAWAVELDGRRYELERR